MSTVQYLGRRERAVSSRLTRRCLALCLFSAVLDMARHVPLYSSVLELLRAFAANASLVFLLLPESWENEDEDEDDVRGRGRGSNPLAISNLLSTMNTCVGAYARTLR